MDTFRQLKIIFFVLAAGQIIYFLISLILVTEEFVDLSRNYSTILGFVVPVLVVILAVTSKLYYNKLINSNVKDASPEKKLSVYRTANIIKFALLEGANILSITFYLITGDFLYVGIFVIVMGIFLINYPAKEKFMADFGLSSFESTHST